MLPAVVPTDVSMPVLATVACPHCHHTFDMEYVRLGALAPCPSCKAPGIADIPRGGTYPMRDYEMTFRSFMQLISFEPYRDKVGPFMRMMGMIVLGYDEDARLERQDGTPVDPLEAHLELQTGEQSQRDIYQVAMSVWR